MNRLIRLLFAMLLVGACHLATAGGTADVDAMMDAFYNNNYSMARRLATKLADTPRGLLVLAYCDIHDPSNRNWARGLERLQRVVRMTAVTEPGLSRAATMSLARTVDALEAMEQLPSGVAVDVDALCRQFLAADPPVIETW
jgi:hypothetical protein